MDALLNSARRVHASHSALVDVVTCDGVQIAIKHFPGRSAIQRLFDRKFGSPACRALDAAVYLQAHGVATARPIAAVGGSNSGVSGSLLLTEWLGAHVSLKDVLIDLFSSGGEAPQIVELLRVVADAVRGMHDAGCWHRDLGNQNILLCRDDSGVPHSPVFIDLNRARTGVDLSMGQRAFDLSRLHLPSDLRRILHELYFDARPPKAFQRAEARYRRRFAFHTATRAWRHPLRTWRNREKPRDDYPLWRDLWIWDPASVQAVAALRGRERRRLMCKRDWITMLAQSVRWALPVRRMAKRLREGAFQTPVAMAGRVGIAISARQETEAFEDECLAELGPLHVLARFYAHASEHEWAHMAERLRRLHSAGHAFSVVLVQDRRAVTDPARWRTFVSYVFERVGGMVTDVQVGQAVNRTKWGVWSAREYAGLFAIARDAARAYPDVTLIGPAVIDFEPHYLLGMLAALPVDEPLGGVGHLLYVDRRGAPENRQGRQDTLAKLAVLRAVSRLSTRTADRLVISETNWPLADTGICSPICSPYLYSGQTVAGGVDEWTYGYYMIRYLLIALCSGLAERVCWWRLCAHGFGLVDDRSVDPPRKRPAYAMLLHFARQIEASTFTGKREPHPGLHLYRFAGGPSGSFTIAYAEARAGERRVEIPFQRVTNATGEGIDAFDGVLPSTGAPIYLYETPN